MLSIVYSSSASASFIEADLPKLLTQSRDNNALLRLTGLLLYRDGHFLQLLEGDDDIVRDRMDVIAGDPRHQRVRILLEDSIEAREFPDRTMGYGAVAPGYVDSVPGYRTTFDDIAASEIDPSSFIAALRELIRWFRTQPTSLL